MKIYDHLSQFKAVENAVVTLGTFDGLHIGHQQVIAKLKKIALETQGETVVLTFFPHPRFVLNPKDTSLSLLNTLSEKTTLFEKLGIDHLLIIPFSTKFANLSYTEFIQQILVDRLGTKKLVIGYDHRFGKDRAGSFQHLKLLAPSYDFQVEEIPEQDVNAIAVSSTKIRDALQKGNILVANAFLGYPYSLTGTVVKGDQLGQTLGYKTANLIVSDQHKLIPADACYVVKVEIGNTYCGGMLYIGKRPALAGTERRIEVHIFNFNTDIYNQSITLHFIDFLRKDSNFASLEALKVQLGLDECKALEMLAAER